MADALSSVAQGRAFLELVKALPLDTKQHQQLEAAGLALWRAGAAAAEGKENASPSENGAVAVSKPELPPALVELPGLQVPSLHPQPLTRPQPQLCTVCWQGPGRNRCGWAADGRSRAVLVRSSCSPEANSTSASCLTA
jgi:hypothetical protein